MITQEDILSQEPTPEPEAEIPPMDESSTDGSEDVFEEIQEVEPEEEPEAEPEEELEVEPEVETPPETPPVPEYVETLLQKISQLEQKVAPVPAKPVVEDINTLMQKYPGATQEAHERYDEVFKSEVDREVAKKGGWDALTTGEISGIEEDAKKEAFKKSQQKFNREVSREKKLERILAATAPPDPQEEKAKHIASIVPEYADLLNSPDPQVRRLGIKAAAATYDKAYGDAPAASKTSRKQPTTPPSAPKYKSPKSGKRKRTGGALQASAKNLELARRMFPDNYSTPEKAKATEKHILDTMKQGRR